MLFRKITIHLTDQNWFAVFLDFIIVVVGVFLGIQVANWNEAQQDQKEQLVILELLESDIQSDIQLIEFITEFQKLMKADYLFCLDVLARKIDAPKSEFDKRFASMITLPSFTQKRTSFENLVSSGKLELIESQTLTNQLINYYNHSYDGWNTAMQDYTRNIIAPFLMEFDYIQLPNNQSDNIKSRMEVKYRTSNQIDLIQFDVKQKNLDDYRNSIFIINALRYRVLNIEGQIDSYKALLDLSELLLEKINFEKLKISKGK